MVDMMNDMPMEEIKCPFCRSFKGLDKVDREACDACDECDEDGLIGIPYDDASIVWTLDHLTAQAAHEEIRGIVVVVEKGDGSIEQYHRGYLLRSKGSDALEHIAKDMREMWAKVKVESNGH